jgi:hypothetical protein
MTNSTGELMTVVVQSVRTPGLATVIMTAATLKTLIMTVSMPKGIRSRRRGSLRWSS